MWSRRVIHSDFKNVNFLKNRFFQILCFSDMKHLYFFWFRERWRKSYRSSFFFSTSISKIQLLTWRAKLGKICALSAFWQNIERRALNKRLTWKLCFIEIYFRSISNHIINASAHTLSQILCICAHQSQLLCLRMLQNSDFKWIMNFAHFKQQISLNFFDVFVEHFERFCCDTSKTSLNFVILYLHL